VFFALARQRLTCCLQCFLRAPTAYEHPNFFTKWRI
jgi:hypothetical protein